MACSSKSNPTIVVIGAGVIGLSSALKLQTLLAGHFAAETAKVLLVAREWPAAIPGAPLMHSADYASMWAGAHVRPIPATTAQTKREAGWLKTTVAEFESLVELEPWAGLTRTPGTELYDAPSEEYTSQTATTFEADSGMRGYRRLSTSELPEDVALGFTYDTFCLNPPMYCENLLRKFLLQGGKTLKRDLRSELEAFSLAQNVIFVVNASGIGFGDPNYFPTRGHLVITDLASAKKTVTRQNKDGSWSFIVPRFFNGGTTIGGTREPGNWDLESDILTRDSILDAGLKLEPLVRADTYHGKASSGSKVGVITDVIARRPTRIGGMRLEIEERALPIPTEIKQSVHIIHAYGSGGRGYEMSWGIASEVAELAEQLLSSRLDRDN